MTVLSDIHEVLRDNVEFTTAAGFLIGILLGNWFSIERDRRKEFNEIVNPIYFRMKAQIEAGVIAVDDFDTDRIERYIPWYKKRLFRKRAERYKNAKHCVSVYDLTTSSAVVDEVAKANMLKCATDVLRHLKPR